MRHFFRNTLQICTLIQYNRVKLKLKRTPIDAVRCAGGDWRRLGGRAARAIHESRILEERVRRSDGLRAPTPHQEEHHHKSAERNERYDCEHLRKL